MSSYASQAAPKPLIAAKVEPSMKAAFVDFARRSGKSESDMLRLILDQVLANNPSPALPPAGFKNSGRRFEIRLWQDELAAVEALAQAESRSVPAWIVALIRRVALRAVPFNARELESVNRAIATLGPIGRNLNVLTKHFHQTGRVRQDDVPTTQLVAAVAELRAQVLALAEGTRRRFEGDAE